MQVSRPTLLAANLVSTGETLEVKCVFSSLPENVTINVVLFQEDEVDIFWKAEVPLTQTEEEWKGVLSLESHPERRLFRVAEIRFGETNVSLSPNLPFLEPADGANWISGEEAEKFQQDLSNQRNSLYNVPIEQNPHRDDHVSFFAVAIAERLMLTIPQRVPGILAIPIENTTLGMDAREILNAVSSQFGVIGQIPSEIWQNQLRGRKNVVAFVIEEIRAVDAEAACSLAQLPLTNLGNLLGRRRNAIPRLLGGLIARRSEGGRLEYQGCWTNEPSYQGNLVGGFISGEDQHHLVEQWNNLSNRPRAQLWLSLFQDARNTPRWDHQFFRMFGLMEAISAEQFPSEQNVTDAVGNTRMMLNGKPFRTSHARGGVYQLVANLCRTSNFPESFFGTRLSSTGNPADFWDEVGIWTDLRNEVVHEGGWEILMPPQDRVRHQRLVDAFLDRSQNQSIPEGIDSVLRSIRACTEYVIDASIRGAI